MCANNIFRGELNRSSCDMSFVIHFRDIVELEMEEKKYIVFLNVTKKFLQFLYFRKHFQTIKIRNFFFIFENKFLTPNKIHLVFSV